MNKTLELSKKVEELYKKVDIDITGMPVDSQPSWEIAKRQAKDELTETIIQYKTTLLKGLSVILLLSDYKKNVETYLKLSQKEGIKITINSQNLYNRLTDQIEPMAGSDRQYTVNIASRLMQEINTEASKVGLRNLPNLDYSYEYMETRESAEKLVKRLVRNKYGDEFNTRILLTEILNKSIELRHSKDILPVIVYGLSDEELPEFQNKFKTNITVNLDLIKNIDKKFVVHTFGDLMHQFDLNKK